MSFTDIEVEVAALAVPYLIGYSIAIPLVVLAWVVGGWEVEDDDR